MNTIWFHAFTQINYLVTKKEKKGEKSYLGSIIPKIYVEGMVELDNHSLAITTVIIISESSIKLINKNSIKFIQ